MEGNSGPSRPPAVPRGNTEIPRFPIDRNSKISEIPKPKVSESAPIFPLVKLEQVIIQSGHGLDMSMVKKNFFGFTAQKCIRVRWAKKEKRHKHKGQNLRCPRGRVAARGPGIGCDDEADSTYLHPSSLGVQLRPKNSEPLSSRTAARVGAKEGWLLS